MPELHELVVSVLLLTGSAFMLIASIGVVRMPDLLIRMHASTKGGTLGAGFLLLGMAVHFGELAVVTTCLAAIFFLVVTAPVAAHLIARAGYLKEIDLWEGMSTDEVLEGFEEPHMASDPTIGGETEES